MNLKTNLLIFSHNQFGYSITPFKISEKINNKGSFNVTYLGWDYGRKKIYVEGVEVKYISRNGNILLRNIRLLKALHQELRSKKYNVTILQYTRGISLVRLLNLKKKMIFDVRTLSVSDSTWSRKIFNTFLKLESCFFKKKSTISEGVARQLGFKKYFLLPLGADVITREQSIKNKDLHLLYVGTLQFRQMIVCVRGFHKYLLKSGNKSAKFTIVGDSFGAELNEIKTYISDHQLEECILTPGRIPHNQLYKHYNNATIGVSFIPMTSWYEHQPVTKTYEYLLAGLPVIATKTYENRIVLHDEYLSELINDNEDEFSEAIENLNNKLILAGEDLCKDLSKKYNKYTWDNIVSNYFVPEINRYIHNVNEISN